MVADHFSGKLSKVGVAKHVSRQNICALSITWLCASYIAQGESGVKGLTMMPHFPNVGTMILSATVLLTPEHTVPILYSNFIWRHMRQRNISCTPDVGCYMWRYNLYYSPLPSLEVTE